MTMLRVGRLPDGALDAAAVFHADVIPQVRERLAAGPAYLIVVFDPADHTHRAWRRAAVQQLAREYAPVRINALESDEEAAIEAAAAYCAGAAGLTGQLLILDGNGAGALLSGKP